LFIVGYKLFNVNLGWEGISGSGSGCGSGGDSC